MFYGDPFGVRSEANAQMLESLRKKMLTAMLRNPEIRVIFLDNTNLSISALRKLEGIAHQHGAHFAVNDSFLDVPLETALWRNEQRDRPVPPKVIEDMHKRALKLKPWRYGSLPDIQPYENSKKLPDIILVDIDGTLALKSPERDIYDYTKVHLDLPNPSVTHLITQLASHGWKPVVMSGRSEDCREQTQEWLNKHVWPNLPLYMRPSGDHRPDWVIKSELFDEHIRDRFHVRFVLDDRDQVVALWRDRLQLPTWQVNEGDF